LRELLRFNEFLGAFKTGDHKGRPYEAGFVFIQAAFFYGAVS